MNLEGNSKDKILKTRSVNCIFDLHSYLLVVSHTVSPILRKTPDSVSSLVLLHPGGPQFGGERQEEELQTGDQSCSKNGSNEISFFYGGTK